MNKTELNQSLAFISQPEGELEIILYACLANHEVKKLDVKATDLLQIKQLFVDAIRCNIVEEENYSVISLSTADERGNCFYQYDLELPEELVLLESVISNNQIKNFNFNHEKISEIVTLIVVIADNNHEISLYKKISPVEVIGRGSYLLGKANERFERFNDQLLRITDKFQAIRVAGEVIILDLKAIEKSFGFHDVIRREATIGLDAIRSMRLVSNLETLEELIANISFARKLTKIARYSPVIRNSIPNANIIAFSKTHPAVKNKMRYTNNDTQFMLDTKVSKNLFIKILNDDFLTSELTRLYYDSLAKDSIEVEEFNDIN